jgi:hypothetical protein
MCKLTVSALLAGLTAVMTLVARAQQIRPLTDGSVGSVLNQRFLIERHSSEFASREAQSEMKPNVVVFAGDNVIPQFVDGGSWQTAITVVNLENHPVMFSVLFFKDDGSEFLVPIVGQGVARGVQIALNIASSLTFQTTRTAPTLSQGWALLSQPANTSNNSVGSFAIFRQTVPGGQPQEAVVPAVSQFQGHFVLPVDDTLSVTGIAITNPTANKVIIPANVRNENGTIVDVEQLTLGPFNHTAFALPAVWSSTAGQRGVIEFLASGFGVGALGLRFTGSAFTSLSVLANISWVVP